MDPKLFYEKNYVYVYLSMFVCGYAMCENACRRKKTVLNLLEMDLQTVVNHLTCVFKIRLGSS